MIEHVVDGVVVTDPEALMQRVAYSLDSLDPAYYDAWILSQDMKARGMMHESIIGVFGVYCSLSPQEIDRVLRIGAIQSTVGRETWRLSPGETIVLKSQDGQEVVLAEADS